MKTLLLLLVSALFMCCSCSSDPPKRSWGELTPDEMKSLQESLRADSAAKMHAFLASDVGKSGLVGYWKSSFSEYAYNFSVNLDIRPPAQEGGDFQCVWTEQDELGSQRQTYTLAMKYDGDRLIGKGKLHVDGTEVLIFMDDPSVPFLYVGIQYAGRTEPWPLRFTR